MVDVVVIVVDTDEWRVDRVDNDGRQIVERAVVEITRIRSGRVGETRTLFI
jgi:hypothetical protein